MPSSGKAASASRSASGSRPRGWKKRSAQKTGLLLDAYFSGTKIKHLLDAIDGLAPPPQRGEVLFGTVDTWLLWRLTGGRLHVTDYSNASRTLLFNIHTLDWDDELLRMLDVPRRDAAGGPPVEPGLRRRRTACFGGPILIAGDAGDQQAASFGQACFAAGHGQEHLRHRLFPADEHRTEAGRRRTIDC